LEEDLDAVMVLTSDEFHADCVVAACRQGMDVFVEKPICLGPREAESILRARDDAGVHVMVGYMRRYAPAFVSAVAEVHTWDTITYASLRDIIGVNRLLIDQTSVVERPDDIPAALTRERERRAAQLVHEAIGDVPSELRRMYRLLCGLASHDISAMRELLGPPSAVAGAAQWHGGNFVHIVFDYGLFGATLDVGVDRQKRFDCYLEVGSELESIRVRYDTPYVRQLPTTLVTAKTEGEAHTTSVSRPTFKDPYTFELEHFHAVVTERRPPKTDVEDALKDLELFREIVRTVRQDGA
jgi:predicted dehydrogenase